ncbi:prolipoprotein diacylglyceryl transferase [Demequina sp. NBRC 110052]|uniref:prolipoprotein diacylglyceryl transferase n=1 Tax=Demequina sp. NBRC 110052 TaxID=1570341 RepID=UPI000A030B02|nr:prolipoprotein diacylglyceryl transferase [Demequina sp. NBRC 110052]
MLPVLFSIGGLDVQSYGVSKALAALVAAYLLGRAFRTRGLEPDDAHAMVMWATIWGFVGGKIYFLLEHADQLSWHHLGGAGFTWYGGLIGGVATFLIMIRRRHLPAATVIDAAAIPLALAYGIGRLGCWLSGDGTYGKPTDLPWGETYPQGMVPTEVPVHPTPLYESLAALVIVAILWTVRRLPLRPLQLFGAYLILSGISRFLVEFLRINEPALLGLTQPQLWSLASVIGGAAIIVAAQRRAPGPVDALPVTEQAAASQ